MNNFKNLATIYDIIKEMPVKDIEAEAKAIAHQNQLTKPPGALGILEELAVFLASWQRKTKPSLNSVQAIVFAGNHGICSQGVNPFPQEVTIQMVENFKAGGAAINQLCEVNGANLNIVPLYETIPDLESAPKLLFNLFKDELYDSYLNNKNRFQEIMLGYSDSNKDGGFGMANFSLNNCQIKISELMIKNNIDFRIFHGRGGSISRGGGKSNKAILSLPDECQNGNIRFTEQGEVVNYRYGSSQIAKRHLEQIVSAQLVVLEKSKKEDDKSSNNFITQIMLDSQSYYKEKVLSDPCWQFLLNASPMKQISKIPITSRPASRNKIRDDVLGFNELRAIPWVFSWTQVRYNLSGWFGMGFALSRALKNPAVLKNLKLM